MVYTPHPPSAGVLHEWPLGLLVAVFADDGVAGEADGQGDPDGADDEGRLREEDLARLQVPARHQVLPQLGIRLDLKIFRVSP